MSEQTQAEKQQEFKTVDIVDFSIEKKTLKVNDAFNQLISSKVVDMFANKKQEVSNNMFADKVETEPEEEIQAEQQAAAQQQLIQSLGPAALGSRLLDPKVNAEAGLADAQAQQLQQQGGTSDANQEVQ